MEDSAWDHSLYLTVAYLNPQTRLLARIIQVRQMNIIRAGLDLRIMLASTIIHPIIAQTPTSSRAVWRRRILAIRTFGIPSTLNLPDIRHNLVD